MSATSLRSQWTPRKFENLCRGIIESRYHPQNIRDYLLTPRTPAAILRHDIDRFPANALTLARIEHRLGLSSTYYARTGRRVLDHDVLRELHNLGHEVGYHYEVLSKCKGDRDAARELFARELAALRSVVPIQTAAMHGSPLSPWNNLDLWRDTEPSQFELVGEPYLAIDYSTVAYYTDTGRSWDSARSNLRDRVDLDNTVFPSVRTTDELTALIAAGTCASICIQTHPERWNPMGLGWLRSFTLDLAANGVKTILAWKLHRTGAGD